MAANIGDFQLISTNRCRGKLTEDGFSQIHFAEKKVNIQLIVISDKRNHLIETVKTRK